VRIPKQINNQPQAKPSWIPWWSDFRRSGLTASLFLNSRKSLPRLLFLEQTYAITRQRAEKESAGANKPVARVMAKPAVNKPRETKSCTGQKEQKAEDVTGSHYEYLEFLHAYLQELSQRRNLACTRIDPLKIVRA
jgi:hypothetical protein